MPNQNIIQSQKCIQRHQFKNNTYILTVKIIESTSKTITMLKPNQFKSPANKWSQMTRKRCNSSKPVVEITLTKRNEINFNNEENKVMNMVEMKAQDKILKQQICPDYRLVWGSSGKKENLHRSNAQGMEPNKCSTGSQIKQKLRGLTKTFIRDTSRKGDQSRVTKRTLIEVTDQNSITSRSQSKIVEDSKNSGSLKTSRVKSREGQSMHPVKPSMINSSSSYRSLKAKTQPREKVQKERLVSCDEKEKQTEGRQISDTVEQAEKQLINTEEPLEVQQMRTRKQIVEYYERQLNLKDQENQFLKQEISVLSNRLQGCIEQIERIETDHNLEKVLELEHKLSEQKAERRNDCQLYQREIQKLKRQLQVKQKEVESQDKLKICESHLCSFSIESSEEVNSLRETVLRLSKELQQSKNPQIRNQKSQLESCQHDLSVLKMKYCSIESILTSKKNEIKEKDSVIKILLDRVQRQNSDKKETYSSNGFTEKNPLAENVLSFIQSQLKEQQ